MLLLAGLSCPSWTACLSLDNDQIRAGDAAQLDPAFGAISPSLRLSYAPMPGKQRIVAVEEWNRWAKDHGVQATLDSPVCFERAQADLSKEAIARAIKQAVEPGVTMARLEVLEVCACAVPPGKLEFSSPGASLPPSATPDTPMTWRGKVVTAGGASYPIWARVIALAQWTVVKTKAPLSAGHILAASELQEVQITEALLRRSRSETMAYYLGKPLNRAVAAETTLQPGWTALPPEVPRSSLVTVLVRVGPLHLALQARAEAEGHTGDRIPVTNLSGQKRFTAVVTGAGTAEVELTPQSLAEKAENNPGTTATSSRKAL